MSNELAPARAGALTGGLLGAVCRPVVVAGFWLVGNLESTAALAMLLASSAIGLFVGSLVGWVAGSVRHPVLSLLLGAGLGAVVTLGSSVLTVCCLCIATDGRTTAIGPYWLAMCLAGALAGAGGGLAGGRVRRQQADERAAEQPQDPENLEDESATPVRLEEHQPRDSGT